MSDQVDDAGEVRIPLDWDPLVPLDTPRGVHHPATRCYISLGRYIRVEDAAQRRGGQDPEPYVRDAEGTLPPFADGTPARLYYCSACGRKVPVMWVELARPRREAWICAPCCPAESLPG